MKEIELKGNNAEEKIAHAQMILNRLARRSQKEVAVATACCPVSAAIEHLLPTGELFLFFSPVSGTIKTICLEIEWPEFQKASLMIFIQRSNSNAKLLFVDKGVNVLETDITVEKGDKVKFLLQDIQSKQRDGVVTTPDRFLLSFSICSTSVDMKKLAIDTLEASASEIISN